MQTKRVSKFQQGDSLSLDYENDGRQKQAFEAETPMMRIVDVIGEMDASANRDLTV